MYNRYQQKLLYMCNIYQHYILRTACHKMLGAPTYQVHIFFKVDMEFFTQDKTYMYRYKLQLPR